MQSSRKFTTLSLAESGLVSCPSLECPKFLLISMNSHGIPSYTMRTGIGAARPHAKNSQVRFHTGPAFIERRDPARERADIPPGGARSWTSPQVGTRAADWAVAAAQFAVSNFKATHVAKTVRGRVRQWHADSEVKATTRWTQRAGSRSRPLFAVCLNPQIPIGNPEKRPNW